MFVHCKGYESSVRECEQRLNMKTTRSVYISCDTTGIYTDIYFGIHIGLILIVMSTVQFTETKMATESSWFRGHWVKD